MTDISIINYFFILILYFSKWLIELNCFNLKAEINYAIISPQFIASCEMIFIEAGILSILKKTRNTFTININRNENRNVRLLEMDTLHKVKTDTNVYNVTTGNFANTLDTHSCF